MLTTIPHTEIEAKFAQLTWLERDRAAQAWQNPDPDFRWARPTGPHLRLLDRYANIHPWQNHRVKLRVPEGKNDYINASPIVLHPSPRPGNEQPEPDRYIAMQGPKTATIDHVWRMVVEQTESPAVIVMLTETHDGGMKKCSQYFPRSKDDPPFEIGQADEFGDGFRATVRCEGLEETPAGDAIELRKLVIRVHPRTTPSDAPSDETPAAAQPADEGEERIVWHFLYKKWPDFGVPDVADLESFFTLMRLSRERNAGPHNPRIVHCSAGVGRSGTFICLEHLMRELDAGVLEHYDEQRAATPVSGGGATPPATPVVVEEGRDLVFDAVNELREQRKTMVQAEIQYLFIYKVLRRLWQDRYGSGETGEPAAKRLEVDPFVEPLANGRFGDEEDEVKVREV